MALKIYDLTHTFTQFMPEWPSTPSVNIDVDKFHAKDGVYQVQWEGIMHRCTHMDAPLHVTENTPTIADYPLWRLFGTGVCVSIPKEKWGIITAEDLENATPKIQEGDIVVINTGFHHLWADTDEYFAYGCGIYAEGAQWLVDKKVKMVAYGAQANDHPIATKLVNHGLGPTHPHLIEEWKQTYGHDPHRGLPRLGDGPQDPHGQRRHPGYRERGRRSRRDQRQALHLHGLPVAVARGGRLHSPLAGHHRPGSDLPLRDGGVDRAAGRQGRMVGAGRATQSSLTRAEKAKGPGGMPPGPFSCVRRRRALGAAAGAMA